MKISFYFKDLSKKDKVKMQIGFFKAVFDRQRNYVAMLTPILLAGLYGTKMKAFIIFVASHYWFLFIPAWIGLIFFDMFYLLPGEQIFYAKSNKLFMEMYSGIKNGKGEQHE